METVIIMDESKGSYKTKLLDDDLRNNKSLKFVVFTCPAGIQYEFISHWHTDYEIMLPISGYVEFTVNGKDYCIKKGEALLVNTGDVHGHKDSFTHEYGEYACFSFDESFVFPDKCSHIYDKYFKPIFKQEVTFTKHITGECEYEREIITALQNIYKQKDTLYENALSIQINLLTVFNLMVNHNAFVKSINSTNINIVTTVVKYIHQYFDTPILISELADQMHVSPDYLTRIFKEEIGSTPKNYLLNHRLSVFMHYLQANPTEKISDLAMKCGFTDPNYFARIFKIKIGLTPSEYLLKLL